MTSKSKAFAFFNAISIFLATISLSPEVLCLEDLVGEVDAVAVTSVKALESAVEDLRSGQTLLIDAEEVALTAPLAITASNVAIRGRTKMTRVLCPSVGEAIVVTGTNVSLSQLEFSGCDGASALKIGTGDDQSSFRLTTFEEVMHQTKWNNEMSCEVYLRMCTFTHNRSPKGAAITSVNARLLIVDTTFRSNEASAAGGAIFAASSELQVESTSFINNAAVNGHGGAMYVEDGDLVVKETEFRENRAGQFGGAMYVEVADLTIKETKFDSNQAGDSGGAIFALSFELRFEDAAFVKNSAPSPAGYGGAMYLEDGDLIVAESYFNENRAGQFGGAMYMQQGNLIVRETVFGGNEAVEYGGAIISVDCTLEVRGASFENNTLSQWMSVGGAIAAAQEELSDVVVRIVDTNFTRNRASFGAAIFTGIPLQVVDSRFVENVADIGGGAISSVTMAQESSIYSSHFERNSAEMKGTLEIVLELASEDPFDTWQFEREGGTFSTAGGGAINVDSASLLDITDCTFSENRAFQGGAIVSKGASSPTQLKITHSSFVSNEAEIFGGALHAEIGCSLSLATVDLRDNSANRGGAIHLAEGSKFLTSYSANEQLYFYNNTAIQGGAINCFTCVLRLNSRILFDQNVALGYGGAVYVEEAGKESNISRATFDGNVAAFGGALFLRNCPLFRCSSETKIEFTHNIALEGGALYLESRDGLLEAYRVQNSHFEGNRALDMETMMSEAHAPSLEQWQKQARQNTQEKSAPWLHCLDCIYGRGGAMFIGLHNRRLDSSINIMFQQLEITGNSASVGGGVYIDNEPGNWDREVDVWCATVPGLSDPPCQFFGFKRVVVSHNTASISGGGLFISAPKDLSSFCIADHGKLSQACKTGDANAIYLDDNQISKDGGGYGPDLATGARSLELMNVDGPLAELKTGEKLVVWSRQEEIASSEIRLVVKDMLNEIVSRGTKDAELEVYLVSKWMSGIRAYNATEGFITISDTTVSGVDITDRLVIQAADERNISVTVEFSTQACSPGELHSEAKTSCFRCRKNFYSFQASQDGCQLCEENAICDGTTALVPQDHYWHANPFSPVMRRCLVKKACKYRHKDGKGVVKSREDRLMEYYDDYENVKTDLAKFEEQNAVHSFDFSEVYPQCAPGYEGVLCGSCAGNYGHTSGGACKECDQNLGLTRFLAGLIILALFVVITFKVVLEIRGVVEDVSFELAQQRTAVESFINQASGEAPCNEGSMQREQNQDDATSSKPQMDWKAEENELSEASSAGAGPSAGSSATRPLLQRLDAIEDLSADMDKKDGNTASPELMDASASLSDTYNILYNYMQLNSVALSLDVDWTKTLRYFFSVEASLARLMDIQFLPFDCSFGDREDDSGFPNSLASLWYRVCFPLVTIVVYLFAMKIYVWIRGERQHSKYDVGLIPKRLIFLVVYLSCCIDIFADLLRVMKCVDLTPDIPESHPYAKYEVMERKSVWMGDTAVTCWEGAHLASAIAAGIGLCMCLGIIVFTVAILFSGKRGRRLRNPQFLLSYGFLYLSYRTDGVALYWESVITLRRMLLAAVGVYAEHGETSNVQIGFLAFIIFIFIALHEVVKPFDQEDSKDVIPSYAGRSLRILGANDVADQWLAFNQYVTLNGMEGASLFMSLSLFLVATSINDEKANRNEINFLLIVCFAVNAVFVLFMLLRLWYGVHHYLDVVAKERNIAFRGDAVPGQDSVTTLPKKLWIVLKPGKKEPIVEEHDEEKP